MQVVSDEEHGWVEALAHVAQEGQDRTESSSAETASSAIGTSGSKARARAMEIRWR